MYLQTLENWFQSLKWTNHTGSQGIHTETGFGAQIMQTPTMNGEGPDKDPDHASGQDARDGTAEGPLQTGLEKQPWKPPVTVSHLRSPQEWMTQNPVSVTPSKRARCPFLFHRKGRPQSWASQLSCKLRERR